MSRLKEALALAGELGPQFAARAGQHDAMDTFVMDNYAALKAARVFSALVPADLGGGGWAYADMCAFVRALAGHCASTALALSMHQHLVSAQVWNHLHGRPGRKLLERVAAEQLVLVSTGARDWMESNGTVEKVEGGFRITAQKGFASGSPAGSMLVTSAPYQDPAQGWQVLHFAVPLSAPGVSIKEDWQTLGMRGTGSHTVMLERVLVPEDAISLRRPRGEFHFIWALVLTVAMPLISSAYAGIADAAADAAQRHAAKLRDLDDAALSQLGALENCRTMAALAADSMAALPNNFDCLPDAALANASLVRKSIVVRAARETVEKAMDVCGGAAYFRRFGLERLLRDVFAGQYHPLPEAKQQVFTGRLLVGRDPVTGKIPQAKERAA